MKQVTQKFFSSISVPLGLFLTALVLRVVFLDTIPWGFHWDEASYAYNAYSIMQTGKDEWGVSFPLFLEAYGDFKPALLSYLMIPFFSILGVTEFAARLPVALLASGSIVAFYFLCKKHLGWKKSVLAALFLSITPWHMHYSRIAFDPMVSLSFLMIGWAFFQEIRSPQKRILGVIFFLLSMYTYNASRLLVPLIVGLHEFFFVWKGNIKTYLKLHGVTLSLVVLTVISMLVVTLQSSAGDRARSVFFWDREVANSVVEKGIYRSIITELPFIRVFHNKAIYVFDQFFLQYFSHFSPEFLFPHNNQSPAFAFPQQGYLLYIYIPFLIIGILFTKKDSSWKFFFLWLLVSPLPSSLSQGAPNGNRALSMLPALLYFVTVGTTYFLDLSARSVPKGMRLPVKVLVMLFFLANSAFYLRDTYLFFPEKSEPYWHGFYEVAAKDIYEKQDDYSVIYMSEGDTQVYIFFAWYNKIDPEHIQSFAKNREHGSINGLGQVENIAITTVKSHTAPCLLKEENVMVVSSQPDGEVLPKQIEPEYVYYHKNRFFPQDEVALRVYTSQTLSEFEQELLSKLCRDI